MRPFKEIARDREAARDKLTAIAAEQRDLTARLHAEERTADDGEAERLARLERGYQKAQADEDRLADEFRAALLEHAEEHPESRSDYRPPETPDRSTQPVGPERDAAMRAVDRLHKTGELPDHGARNVETLLGTGSQAERSIAARWAAATGDPAYRDAFLSLMADPQRGHLLWDARQLAAFRKVEELRAYMSLTDNVGGFMVPLALDPAIILSSAGTTNTMRRIATVKQTVSESWQGVTSAGVSAEWLAENTQAAEATPTLAAVPIPVFKLAAFTPFSYEVGMDAVGFQTELAKVLVDAADSKAATAYTVGAGTTEPVGVVTALVGGASEINTQGSEATASTDPFDLQAALPARFSPNAAFMAHRAIINEYAIMETTNGALMFPEIREGRLLGKPLYENSDMDGAYNAAATANNYVMVYGDFSNYYIVDRIGTTIEVIQNLMGANYRPTGSRGAFLWSRTGGHVSTINAFRLLDVPTTA